ncbi:cytochrome c biogenesis protein CcsA [Nonomuraea glycinis]|uniref:C-type cytochrome biogenesis protein CcsB n=1 Tax=Nonomuraea glycinis TaxID=2047744 RepID=A0A918E8C8_9ACTN|nr:cytochrome c biogenesis protein CcsA [Nonomuraea glycinis]MCA2178328.1 cytochrome c biogenesis protein CcsA [Nonomuraea glycinis]GGP12485.1 c-type cytochrome biogenesis protein CcsB [Nonomuraea glycinis]
MNAEGLAELSDLFVVAAVLLYLFSMVGFAMELAFGRTRLDQESAAAKVPVAVGAATVVDAPVDEAAETPAAGGPVWSVRAGMVGLGLAWLGWAANLGAIVTRGVAVERWPWGNMYEFVVGICFAAVTAFLVTQFRRNVRFLGAFVMVTAALGLGLAVKTLYTSAGPVVPALDSYWIAIHVTAAILASGMFILAGVAGILNLIRKEGPSRLPSKAELEKVANRAIVLAFPLWTFAVIAGALWADRAWGRYWGWDPKEVWSFITWVGYAAYLHANVTAGWRGRRATIVQLVAFACLLFNLFGVNIFISGLHSYSGL